MPSCSLSPRGMSLSPISPFRIRRAEARARRERLMLWAILVVKL
jgi:hypothetical protein